MGSWRPITATWTCPLITCMAKASGPAPGTIWKSGRGNSRPWPPGKSSSPGTSPCRPWRPWGSASPGTPSFPWKAGNGLALTWEDRTLELEAPDRPALVREVARWLCRVNPDLVLSDWGDEYIMPRLWRWSRETGVPLPLDREPGAPPRKFSGGRTYFSYGRVVYQGSAAPLYGRWHVDRRNSFFFREADLMGLVQISRLGQIPLQQAARASPGTLITSMQLARAVQDGILIPWRKADPERFKSAGELLTVDKGGLVFMPPIGLFAEVAELDFASMYPTIMAIHNISPETVNCRCCADVGVGEGGSHGQDARATGGHRRDPRLPCAGKIRLEKSLKAPFTRVTRVGRGVWGEGRDLRSLPRPSPHHNLVPEARYRLCRRREGLVPRTLRPILDLAGGSEGRGPTSPAGAGRLYQQRQTALKWMLVTCFGYLGYKNARFGRIEAHEAVTAFGRDKLLTAKEICEAAGYRVLHGLTDCVWIHKDGLTRRNSRSCAAKSPPPPASSWPWRGCTAGLRFCPPGRTGPGRWPPATSGSLPTVR
jgi:hypothetical protein